MGGAFRNNDDRAQLYAVAHRNHHLALDVIEAVGNRLEPGRGFAGQTGVLWWQRRLWCLRQSSSEAQDCARPDESQDDANAVVNSHAEFPSLIFLEPSARFQIASHGRYPQFSSVVEAAIKLQ